MFFPILTNCAGNIAVFAFIYVKHLLPSLLFLVIFLVVGHHSDKAVGIPFIASKSTLLSDTSDNSLTVVEHNVPPSASPALLADRLSCIEKTVLLSYNRRVHAFVDYFTIKNRDYTRMIVQRINRYFPLFEKYLTHYHLPNELKYLAIVESGLNPKAVSRAGASGLWQFMPSTGREFGLASDRYIDERRDPEKSTRAACRYLAQLYAIFKDWELVLVAYNSGLGNIRKAIKKAGYQRNIGAIYKYLPRETRSYLSQFIAIDYTLNYLAEHNLPAPDGERPIPSDTLIIKDVLHMETLANLIPINVDSLRNLNPSIRGEIIPKRMKNRIINLPVWAKETLDKNRKFILDSASKAGKAALQKNANVSNNE